MSLNCCRHFPAFVALVSLLVAGCRTQSAPQSSTTTVAVESVKPGINAEYLKPSLSVTQWVERFEREGREIFTHRDEIVRAANLKPGLRVADIGAGTGLFTMLFADKVGSKGTVYAVDIVPAFLEHIAVRAGEAGLRNVKTVRCTEKSTSLPPNSVDLAFICDAYHHFEYPQSTMASVHRALRAGGELVLVEFKRIEGTTSDWTFKHVRAGQEVFTAEIESAGFRKTGEEDFLRDNYLVRFRKVTR